MFDCSMFDSNLQHLAIRQYQQDILDQASRDWRVQRIRSSRRSAGLQARLLKGLGGMLIVLGHRLQSRYLERQLCADPFGCEPPLPH